MARGSKDAYTDKQKRKAQHIEQSYRDAGVSAEEAAGRAWATVNRQDGGGKLSGSGRGRKRNVASPQSQIFAVVDSSGQILDTERSEKDAVRFASGISDRVIVDRTIDLGEIIAQNPLGRRGPDVSWRAMKKLRIDASAVEAMSIQEAFDRVSRIFPSSKGGAPLKAWSTPSSMIQSLLGQNYKTSKTTISEGQKRLLAAKYGRTGIDVQGLTMLPNVVWSKITGTIGFNTCVGASRECAESCLVYSGRNEADPYNTVIKTAKLSALIEEPDAFGRILLESCRRHLQARSENLRMVRLNVFSDVPWEMVFPELFEMAGGQYYDYTKVPHRNNPSNYDLTFSYSGRNLDDVNDELDRGRRVAVVFLTQRHRLPSEFLGVPVVDGDLSDARPLDPQQVVVGLAYKAPRQRGAEKVSKTDNLFVVPVHELDGHLVAALVPRDQPDTEDSESMDESQTRAAANPHVLASRLARGASR